MTPHEPSCAVCLPWSCHSAALTTTPPQWSRSTAPPPPAMLPYAHGAAAGMMCAETSCSRHQTAAWCLAASSISLLVARRTVPQVLPPQPAKAVWSYTCGWPIPRRWWAPPGCWSAPPRTAASWTSVWRWRWGICVGWCRNPLQKPPTVIVACCCGWRDCAPVVARSPLPAAPGCSLQCRSWWARCGALHNVPQQCAGWLPSAVQLLPTSRSPLLLPHRCRTLPCTAHPTPMLSWPLTERLWWHQL